MRQFRNRVKAGVMALALSFAQVVVPVAPVFATSNNGTLKVHEKGTLAGTENTDSKVCIFNFEAFGLDANQTGNVTIETQSGAPVIAPKTISLATDGSGNGATAYINDAASSVTLADGHYKATLDNKFGTEQNDKAKSKVFKVECGPVTTSVTAAAGSFVDSCGPTFNAVFNPAVTTGVTYNAVKSGNTINVTATANANYTLSNPAFTQTYTDLLVACPTNDKPTTAVNGTFNDVCGDQFNLSFFAATTEGVNYNAVKTGNTINVTATAKAGYVLSDPNWSQSQTDNLVACPVIKPCVTTSTTIVSKYEDFADYNDTRATGHTEFLSNGLRIYTDGNTNEGPRTDGKAGNWGTDKVAWYNNVTPYSLGDVGVPAIDFENTTNGGVPGMQIVIDIDGNGNIDGILVGEAVYGNNWWLASSNATSQAGAPHTGGGFGSPYYGTLNEWYQKNPNAKVTAVGFSLGSGVKGDGILKSLTFGCQTWVFKKAPRVPTVCTLKDNVYDSPWKYDGDAYPAAGGQGTYNFEPTGLYLNTPIKASYVYGFMDGGITPLVDVNAMSYKTMRLPQSAGYEATHPAYILYVDTNGTSTTGGETVFFYEPYNNDYSRATIEGSFQTWDTLNSGNAKWYVSGTGQALRSWNSLVAEYRDAVVVAYGFNQGSSNQETLTAIQDITFDCATTSFTNKQTGGSGGNTPVTPVTPVTPTVPTVPTLPVGGQGSVLPAELPLTGTNGSILSTWIALLAAILTYGAVYYLQPKRRAE